MIQCLRCGQCCYYRLDGETKRCKFLILLRNAKTCCRIYRHRLGTVIDRSKDGKRFITCIKREEDTRLFSDCPYNLTTSSQYQSSNSEQDTEDCQNGKY